MMTLRRTYFMVRLSIPGSRPFLPPGEPHARSRLLSARRRDDMYLPRYLGFYLYAVRLTFIGSTLPAFIRSLHWRLHTGSRPHRWHVPLSAALLLTTHDAVLHAVLATLLTACSLLHRVCEPALPTIGSYWNNRWFRPAALFILAGESSRDW